MRQWITIVESLNRTPVEWKWTSYGPSRKTAAFTINGKDYGLIVTTYEFNSWKLSEDSNTTHFEFSKPEADY